MIEQMLELDEIMLCPAIKNNGRQDISSYNFGVKDPLDGVQSLPIFTAPMDVVVNRNNWNVFSKSGIRPILPRTEDISIRLEGCSCIFSAFSIREVVENFINRRQNPGNNVLHICIDAGNGHDTNILGIAQTLRKMYGNQVSIMAGNIGNAAIYRDYCLSGIDYVRVGFGGGSVVDHDKYGFYTPLASLLIDINASRKMIVDGIKQTKVIADGGIMTPTDIMKCIALGADYVMCGRLFAKMIDAAGPIYRKTKDALGHPILEELVKGELVNIEKFEIPEMDMQHVYSGLTTYEMQALRDGYKDKSDWLEKTKRRNHVDSHVDWVKITTNLKYWLPEAYDCFSYGFMMAGATDWITYKNNIRYCRVSQL